MRRLQIKRDYFLTFRFDPVTPQNNLLNLSTIYKIEQ